MVWYGIPWDLPLQHKHVHKSKRLFEDFAHSLMKLCSARRGWRKLKNLMYE
jgi:hypothetical protein